MKLKLLKRNFKQLSQLNTLMQQNTPKIVGGRYYYTDIDCDRTNKGCVATETCRACGSRRC
ncbi:hypothetical protein [Pseudoalteromonas umbrosa]|uniref:hypothetical protein n=1 Tax=Pseudoalteromonas umbrosa TaxID=3048489 RepID=UPI0024C2538D|nr:hypothetical protein [Pseudoalteromonas sp. B95]MDK1288407.1 hypothetical protein [Pseudoalteromonas sp. B95]